MKNLIFVLIAALGFVACDDEVTFATITPGEEVSGVWEANATVYITSDVEIPEGQTLIVEEGVNVIFQGEDLGTVNAPEIGVRGQLIVKGTDSKPVVFTVEEANQTVANRYLGMWGGIQCAATCEGLVLENTIVEYAGAPAGPNSIFVEQGEDEEDPRYAILYGNMDGKMVIHNSEIRYTSDDACRVLGGQISVANNLVAYNGETGGEAFNIKSGVTGDFCFNVFYASATNGTKWSNSGDREVQTNIQSYNNTFVACGWRRNKEGRGGSVNIEKGARGNAYNNLIVNCKYGVRLVGGEDAADTLNCNIDNSFYYGNEAIMKDEFYPSHGILFNTDCACDVLDQDPMFEAYDVATSKSADLAIADVDFHLKSASPALTGGKTGFSPIVSSLTINGTTYTTPSPKAYFGALGTK